MDLLDWWDRGRRSRCRGFDIVGSGPPELTQLVKPPVGVEKPRLLAA
jgi:hypothetical protein